MRQTICIERKDGKKLFLDKEGVWDQHDVDKAMALPQVQRFVDGKMVFQGQMSDELKSLSYDGKRGTFKGAYAPEVTVESDVKS